MATVKSNDSAQPFFYSLFFTVPVQVIPYLCSASLSGKHLLVLTCRSTRRNSLIWLCRPSHQFLFMKFLLMPKQISILIPIPWQWHFNCDQIEVQSWLIFLTQLFFSFALSLLLKFLQNHARDVAGFGTAVSCDFPQVRGWKWEGCSLDHSGGL